MTWNIRTGLGSDPSSGEKAADRDLDSVASVINRVRPDIVALQEVDRDRDRSGFVDQTSILAGLTGMQGVFAPNLVDSDGEYGIAVLTRLPVQLSEHIRFPAVDGWEPRGMLDIHIDVNGSGVRVLNTHLQVGFDGTDAYALPQRADAAATIALRARMSHEPVVLMGDLNVDPSAEELEPLRFLTDAWAEQSEEGFTFPASSIHEPEKRIDAILVSRHWLVRDVAVLVTQETRSASDHYPVVADLVLVDEAG